MAAPRTMILFDPELDVPEPAPHGKRASARANSPEIDRNARVPSARTLSRFLADAQNTVRLRGPVNVLLTSDPGIRRLNRQFRGKNKSTDVLSFPAMQVPLTDSGPEPLAGDIAISIPTALKQASQQGHALATELKVLILHGLLHLAGYDHETDEGQMARRERALRAKLNLPQGLIERAATPSSGSSFRRNTSGAPSTRTAKPAGRVGVQVSRTARSAAARTAGAR